MASRNSIGSVGSQDGISSSPGQSRRVSYDARRRVPMPRRATRGPLDGSDEEGDPLRSHSHASAIDDTDTRPQTTTITRSPEPSSARSRSRSARPQSANEAIPDVYFLTRPSLYHSVPTTNIPPTVLRSSHQPDPSTDLETLLSKRQFRHAANKAGSQLTSGTLTRSDHAMILYLYHTRLACLMLIHHTDIAIQESRPLQEWLTHHAATGRNADRDSPYSFVQLIPWRLRLIVHRLQILGIGDPRRGIMALYQFGAECRFSVEKCKRAGEEDQAKIWAERLEEVGLFVASDLIEKGEVQTALRHLDSLTNSCQGARAALFKTLVCIKAGSLAQAERCIAELKARSNADGADAHLVLEALVLMTKGEYGASRTLLSQLHQDHPNDELVTNNLAIAELYCGDAEKTSTLFESLVNDGQSFSSLIFNLASTYELRTERSHERKLELAERLTGLQNSHEATNIELKL